MQIRVLFFGQLKDFSQLSEDTVHFPEGSTVETVFSHYVARFPRLSGLAQSIALARNQQFAQPGDFLADGDEIAFLPPVSGGTAYTQRRVTPEGHIFALTRSVIDTAAIGREVLQGIDGALCSFEGVVRNNTKGRPTRYLEYECYEAMAIRMMEQIGVEIANAHAISRLAMVHRLGRMEIGEASVLIVAAAPHRGPSFEAARDGINRLKKTVPIWKKEFFADGEVWVDGEWDESIVPAGASQQQ
ncbi:molybdenum cofactor biosynthesis protein MoaE [Bryobacter aggregatus]|uniref:molybdenum cofactor biosynthesis protein MoaE n=1 Tax=Bryobacter aggregatus TaxID=360054 RepID=UPI0004E0B37F|nr:molybdenum cofactor biosynthesis protein MoaE [Bryobacter aggregatus]